jgi:hypothetical protein
MPHDTAATWRIVCLLTLGAFVGLGVTAFATGLLPGDRRCASSMAPSSTSSRASSTWRGPGGWPFR